MNDEIRYPHGEKELIDCKFLRDNYKLREMDTICDYLTESYIVIQSLMAELKSVNYLNSICCKKKYERAQFLLSKIIIEQDKRKYDR